MSALTEQEEFEFRRRAEQEANTSRQAQSSAPPANIGISGFGDAVKQVLQEKDWGTRNALGLGAQINKAVHGIDTLVTPDNPLISQAASVASQEAPVGSMIGEGMKYAPALAASGVVAPVMAATTIAGLTQTGGLRDRMKAGADEGLAALAGGVIGKGLGSTFDAVKRYGADASARRIAGDVVGDKAKALALLNNGKTAGLSTEQALADLNQPALAGLSNITKSTSSESTAFHKQLSDAQEAARLASLKSVTPDLTAAESAREAASIANYAQAFKQQAKADPQLAALASNPFFKKAQNESADLIDAKGIDFKTAPIEYLHNVKLGLDKMLSRRGDTALGAGERREVAKVKDELLGWMESKSSFYKQARLEHSQLSEPVNQSQVLQAMAAKLRSPSDGERATSFLNVLGDGEQALLKKATGFPRHQSGDLSKVLSSNQMATVDDISSQLIRDSNVESQLAAPGSRNAALKVIQSDTLQGRIPNLLSRTAMVANKALGELETRLSAKTLAKLDTAMRDPQEMARLLRDAPKQDRGLISNMLMMNPAGLAAALTSNARNQQDNRQLAEQLRRSN